MISDRRSKANNIKDSFSYMITNRRSRKIDTYFILDKESEDYERLCKIGK